MNTALPGVTCLNCRSPLSPTGKQLDCPACGKSYPKVGEVYELVAHQDSEVRQKEKFYESFSDKFEHAVNQYDTERRVLRMFAQLPADLSGKAALDGGCGLGFFSAELARRGAATTSIDISPALAAKAAAKTNGRGFACDIANLPFADASFDVIVSSECIEHTVSPENSFRSLARVLKTGGTMVLSVPNRRWIWSLRVAEALSLRPYRGLENWPTWREVEQWATSSGLTIRAHFGVHPLPFQLPLAPRWLPALEAVAKPLDAWMINQVIVAERR